MTSLPRAIAVLASLAVPVALLSPSATGAHAPATRAFAHFNVARTHSPELLRRLAGSNPPAPATSTGGSAPTASPAAGTTAGTTTAGTTAGTTTAGTTTAGMSSGVDVASFQHKNGATIDWASVAAAGYKFAFVKATEGSYYTNPYFASDFAAAKSAGLAVAAYHFANPADSGGTLQADYAATTARYAPDGKTLPIVLDIEYDPYATLDHTNTCYGLTPPAMVRWITAFTNEVVRRTGQPPIIYTTADWWATCTGSSTAFAGDPLWVAAYSTTSPTLPAGWSSWEFWQYTSAGSVPGITGKADVSYLSNALLALLPPGGQSGAVSQPAQLTVTALGSALSDGITYGATGLPAAVAIDPATGAITGTWPATPQSGTATITATSPTGATGRTSYRWHAHGPVRLTNPGPRAGTSLNPAVLQVQASDSLPGCTLTFTATGLPPGLTMTRCGRITGWITRSGRYQVSVSVTDASAVLLGSVSFTWTVQPPSRHGPIGPVRLAGTRTCMQAPASGSRVVLAQRCDAGSDQAWTAAANGTMRIDRQCLDDPGPAGTAATLHSCDGASSQRWSLVPSTGLVNQATGECLQGPSPATLTTAACNGTTAQQWILVPLPLVSGVPGQCATANPASASGPPTVNLQACRGIARQAWSAMPDESVRASGRCLTTRRATSAGAVLSLATCNGNPAQQWILWGGPLGAQLVNPPSGLCMAKAGSALATAPLTLGPCDDTPGSTVHLN